MKGYWIALVNVTDADTYAQIRLADATSVAEIQCQNYGDYPCYLTYVGDSGMTRGWIGEGLPRAVGCLSSESLSGCQGYWTPLRSGDGRWAT